MKKDPMTETEPNQENEPRDIKAIVLEYVKLIAIVVAAVVVVDGIILINAQIPSASMEKTIMTGDRIFGFRLAYGINVDLGPIQIHTKMKDPERYDIVIFHYPDNEKKLYIKRIIGLPGETLEFKGGKVYVDGSSEPLDDSFATGITYFKGASMPEGTVTVPEGSYFMLGDNRQNSKDSRYWHNQFVAFDKIVGKALFRYWPITKMKNLWV